MNWKLLLRRGEIILLLAGTLLVGVAGLDLLRYSLFQRSVNWSNRTVKSSEAVDAIPRWETKYFLLPTPGGHASSVKVSGRLEIPRLGLSVLVIDGNEEEGLSVAAVHLAETSPIGGRGNTVIAAHRDTAFWPLRSIKVGDRLQIRVGTQVFNYTAQSMQIVEPSDVSVLEGAERPMLTLVTCYPFRYVGNAPKRFVVQAKLVNQ